MLTIRKTLPLLFAQIASACVGAAEPTGEGQQELVTDLCTGDELGVRDLTTGELRIDDGRLVLPEMFMSLPEEELPPELREVLGNADPTDDALMCEIAVELPGLPSGAAGAKNSGQCWTSNLYHVCCCQGFCVPC